MSADVTYEQPVEQTEVINTLAEAGFDDAVVQYLGSNTDLLARLPPQSDATDGLETKLNQPDMAGNDATISVSIIGCVGNEVFKLACHWRCSRHDDAVCGGAFSV